MATLKTKSKEVSLSPWALFAVFCSSSFLASYFPFSLATKFWIVLAGLLLPLGWAAGVLWRNHALSLPPYLAGKDGPMPHWPWILLAALACAVRLWHLTSLSTWPMPDDALYFFYSTELDEKWRWKFFFSHTEFPPLMPWCLALFFKLTGPSLSSLWLFPALLSILTALLALTAARLFLPRPFSFWVAALFAFNFPSLYLGRFCQWAVLVLMWMVLALALSAWLLKGKDDRQRDRASLGLGLVIGAGFFAGVAWPVAALCFTAATWVSLKTSRPRPGRAFALFLIPSAGIAIVFFLLSILQGGHHIRDLWVFGNATALLPLLQEWLAKACSLFWYSPSGSAYGPLWGGLLNPLLGAFFFLGLLECVRYRRQALFRWTCLSLLASLLPGFLAKGFEVFRWSLAFPLMLMICGWGMGRLMTARQNLPWRGSAAILGLLFAVSASLDVYQLAGPYHRLWGEPNPLWKNIKSAELCEAYRILSQTSVPRGKGFVLSDLRVDPTDQTLALACFPFDASRNASVNPQDVRWIAFITDADEKPFLQRRFPQGRWYWLAKKAQTTAEPQMLGVLDFPSVPSPELARWMEADRRTQPLTSAIMDVLAGQSQKSFLAQLKVLQPFFKGDAFLQSCFFEKTAFHQMADKNWPGALEAVREGLRQGYPAAHLYNLEGVLLARLGRNAEARKAFQEALHCEVNFSPALENLNSLPK